VSIHIVNTKADSQDNGSSSSSSNNSGSGGGKFTVSPQAAQKFADSTGGTLYRTSAKTGLGVGVSTTATGRKQAALALQSIHLCHRSMQWSYCSMGAAMAVDETTSDAI
jgi:hypothetical protein